MKIRLPRVTAAGFLLYFSLCLLTGSGYAQVMLTRLGEDVSLAGKQGFVYSLPKTLIRLDLTVKKTMYFQGPYSSYAEKLLGLEDIIVADNIHYSVESAEVTTVCIPDPDHYYFAEVGDKTAKEGKTVLLSMDGRGIIEGINTKAEMEQILPGLSGVPETWYGADNFRFSSGQNRMERVDTIIRRVVVDTFESQKVTYNRYWEIRSDESKAESAAAYLMKIREQRFQLITGYQEIPYPEGTIRHMDQSLRELEEEYLSLFTGVTRYEMLKYTFYLDPPLFSPEGMELPAFTFSERTGVSDAGSPTGRKITLGMRVIDRQDKAAVALGTRDGTGKSEQGFFYRLPAQTAITLSISDRQLVNGIYPVAQYGNVTFLPPDVTVVWFDPETGEITTILFE
ncbi:MAG: DUF4831 family protein [Bacteroidales bacterium]|nr:DUF4831 family protein [Bacteroidales bacterium]